MTKQLAEKNQGAFEPQNITEAVDLAGLLVASRLLPRAIGTKEAAFAIIATGRELGLSAMQSLRSIHVIEGKPTLSADLIAALCKRSPVCAFFSLVESTSTIAHYRTQRIGEPEPTELSFSWADAERAGLPSKDNWRKYPAAMLRARAITALARAVYPDLVMGIYEPDELDERPVATMPPARVAAPALAISSPKQDDEFIDSDRVGVILDTLMLGERDAAKTDLVAAIESAMRAELRSLAASTPDSDKTPEVRAAFAARMNALKSAPKGEGP